MDDCDRSVTRLKRVHVPLLAVLLATKRSDKETALMLVVVGYVLLWQGSLSNPGQCVAGRNEWDFSLCSFEQLTSFSGIVDGGQEVRLRIFNCRRVLRILPN